MCFVERMALNITSGYSLSYLVSREQPPSLRAKKESAQLQLKHSIMQYNEINSQEKVT